MLSTESLEFIAHLRTLEPNGNFEKSLMGGLACLSELFSLASCSFSVNNKRIFAPWGIELVLSPLQVKVFGKYGEPGCCGKHTSQEYRSAADVFCIFRQRVIVE